MKHYPVYEVTWLDHWEDRGETRPSEWLEQMELTSVGYLVRETPEVLTLAQGVNEEGQYSGALHLMKALIVRKKRVRA